MSHKLKFQVEIDFTESIWSAEDEEEVRENILRALVSEVDHGMGLAPENSDAFTDRVTIRSKQFNASITRNF